MRVEHPFDVTPRCRHGVSITDPDAANCAHYEQVFEQWSHTVKGPGRRPRDSREESAIPADTGEDG